MSASGRHLSGRFLMVSMSLLMLALTPANANALRGNATPFCRKPAAGKIVASSGAQMYGFGPQRNGPAAAIAKRLAPALPSGIRNVDAASPGRSYNAEWDTDFRSSRNLNRRRR
jgi:hypothetical protein